jgi:hypothetical protein
MIVHPSADMALYEYLLRTAARWESLHIHRYIVVRQSGVDRPADDRLRATIGLGAFFSRQHVWKQQSTITSNPHTAHVVRRRRSCLSSTILSVCIRRVRHPSYANAVRHAMTLKMPRSVRDMGHSRTHTQPLARLRRMAFRRVSKTHRGRVVDVLPARPTVTLDLYIPA